MRGARGGRSGGGHMKKSLALLVALLATLALMPALAQQDRAGDGSLRSSPKFHRKGARAIPNEYIVVLDQDAVGVKGDTAAVRGDRQRPGRSRRCTGPGVRARASAAFPRQMTSTKRWRSARIRASRSSRRIQIMEAS